LKLRGMPVHEDQVLKFNGRYFDKMKKIIRWFYAWVSQSFFGLIPPVVGVVGAILFINVFPDYGLLFALLWFVLIIYISVKYFRFY